MSINRVFIMTFCLCIVAFSSKTMAQNVQWKKHFGGCDRDYFYGVTAVSDGVVAVGSSYWGREDAMGDGDWDGVPSKGGVGGEDAIIVKYNNAGTMVWKKNFGGLSGNFFYDVVAVSDGVVAVGVSWDTEAGDWAGVPGTGKATIVKFNNDGEVVWKKKFASDEFHSITKVSDGFVVVGFAHHSVFGKGDWSGATAKGSEDAVIVKFDNNGNKVWNKHFGGAHFDHFYGVTAVSDGVVAVGYSTENSFDSGDWTDVKEKGGRDAIIVKYSNNGDVVWKKNFGGSDHDEFLSVTAVSEGIVAVGYSYDDSFGTGDWTNIANKGNEDAIIVKYDFNGDLKWKKNFGSRYAINQFNDVTAVSGGVVAAGYAYHGFDSGDWTGVEGRGNEDATIVKFNDSGAVVWKAPFGGRGDDRFEGIAATSDGIVAVGFSALWSFDNDNSDEYEGDWKGVAGHWDPDSDNGFGDEEAIIVKFTNSGGSGIAKITQETNVKIYPNPTKGELRVESRELKVESVEIFDVFGKSVTQLFCYSTSETIDISSLPAGIYFLKITTESKSVIKKVIKE